jgi:parallel beta-helix repeat protein
MLRYLLLVMTLLVPGGSWAACTHYASPTGGGTGASAGSPFLVSQFWPVAGPGLTLCLVNGVYTGTNSMLTPPDGLSGVSGNPIGIAAINDGQVLIDGQFTSVPLSFYNSSYWHVQGINFKQGVSTTGSLAGTYPYSPDTGSNHNVLQRLIFWDANISTNSLVMSIDSSYDNLLEDIAVFGAGGRMLAFGYGVDPSYGVAPNVCRRCWMRHEGVVGQTYVESLSSSYGGWMGGVCENCLITRTMESQPEVYWLTEQGVKQDEATGNCAVRDWQPGWPCPYQIGNYDWIFDLGLATAEGHGNPANTAIYGGLIYRVKGYGPTDNDKAMLYHASHAGHNEHVIMYSDTTIYTKHGSIQELNTGTTNHMTGIRSATGAPCGTGECFDAGWTNTDFQAATTLAGLLASNPAAHPFTGTQGAQICYQYQNKMLTSIPLWPWPMNQRIQDATGSAGNYFDNGGPGCEPAAGDCSGTRGHTRTATDVTADVQAILGTIPGVCSGTTGIVPVQSTFYMSPTGTDTIATDPAGNCLAAQNPATPRKTFANVFPCMAGGSDLYLAAGLYNDYIDTATVPLASGAPGANTRIFGDAGGSVLKPSSAPYEVVAFNNAEHNIILDNVQIDASLIGSPSWGVSIYPNAAFIIVRNGQIAGASESAVWMVVSSNIQVLNMTLQGLAGSTSAAPLACWSQQTNSVIRGTTIMNGHGPGIGACPTYPSAPHSGTIDRNTIRNNTGAGIVQSASDTVQISNNVIHSNGAGGVNIIP